MDTTSGDPTREDLINQAQEQVAAEQAAAEADTRPEWLPEKFKSPDELAKAYAELERKQGGSPEPEVPTREQVSSSTGLDMDALEAEWRNNGSLSEDSYAEAEKAGYSKEIVDRYIAGQQAIVDQQVSQVYDSVGGQEAYNELLSWAADNLPESEVDTFNNIVGGNDLGQIMLAVKGLSARANGSGGQEPARQIAGGSAAKADVFESQAQVQEAMRDPKYRTDPAYNAAVIAKLARSNL